MVCPVIVTLVTSSVPSASLSLSNTLREVSSPPSLTASLVKSSSLATGGSFCRVTARLTVATLLGAARLSSTV